MEHQALRIEEFNVESNNQFKNESSRIVKICILKYKCIVICLSVILSLGQFIYILSDKILADSSLITSMKSFVSTVSDVILPQINETLTKSHVS